MGADHRPAAGRLIAAFQELETAFAIAGLKVPVAVVVADGERPAVEALMRGNPTLLITDRTCGETSIWGIKVWERTGGR